jgi:hypothetical protein
LSRWRDDQGSPAGLFKDQLDPAFFFQPFDHGADGWLGDLVLLSSGMIAFAFHQVDKITQISEFHIKILSLIAKHSSNVLV